VDRLAGRRADDARGRVPAIAALLPHGGYAHCGAVLGAAMSRVQVPARCIVLGPSHTGSWMPWSLMDRGAYRTPLGDVPVDAALAAALRDRCAFLEADAWAQQGEHAIEVILPFLQRLGPDELSVVPVIVNSEDDGELRRMARALAEAVREVEAPVLLIASSDLSHYEPEATGRMQDRRLLDAVAAFDMARLAGIVRDDGVRMCGYAAALCVLDAAAQLGGTRVTVTGHGMSSEAGGDPQSAIGYAGALIH
jgi:hypothetical protein